MSLHVQIESRDSTQSIQSRKNGKIQSLLKNLQKQKLHYQLTGQYELAEHTMNKIESIKRRTADKNQQKLENNNAKKIRRMKYHQNSVFNQFEKEWNRRIKKFDKNAQKTLTDLHESQEHELHQFADFTRNQFKRSKVKFSPDVLGLREAEYALARQNRFDEAKIVQKQRLKLESQEQLQFRRALDKKFTFVMDKKKIEQRKVFQSLNVSFSLFFKFCIKLHLNFKLYNNEKIENLMSHLWVSFLFYFVFVGSFE